jgi:hypothetical protein
MAQLQDKDIRRYLVLSVEAQRFGKMD